MRPFPPSTNDAYSGSMLSAYFLTLFSVLTIVPGCIHTFAPDGGAGTIAGLDLSQNGRVIIAVSLPKTPYVADGQAVSLRRVTASESIDGCASPKLHLWDSS
jgi:hypothetical protein